TKLGVAIMEDELGLQADRGQRFGKCLGLCLDPCSGRMLGRFGDKDFTAADVQEGDDEKLTHATQRQYLLGKEVALPECGRVHLQELVPGLLTALGTRIKALLAHDVSDKLTGGFLRRELTEFAQDTRVAPAEILAGQLDDQPADI